jgi:hypothetical protein
MIVDIKPSPLKNKRYRATVRLHSGGVKIIDFGYPGATTFIDGATETTRENYLKRHRGNPTEERLIREKIASPALLSAAILWGKHRNIADNIKALNNEWKK